MIVDCASHELKSYDQVGWLILICLTSWIGALIYFFVRRPARIRAVGR